MGKPVIKVENALSLVRLHLMNVDALTALVGDRIRTAHVVDPDAALVYPTVIIDYLGGAGGYQGGMQQLRLHVYAYSDESGLEAIRVYDTTYDGLQAQRVHDPSGAIPSAGYIRELDRPLAGWNEVTRSWYARGTWLLMLAG